MKSLFRRLRGKTSQKTQPNLTEVPVREVEHETLEPRVLFSAAPVEAPADAGEEAPEAGSESQAVTESVVVSPQAAQNAAAALETAETAQEGQIGGSTLSGPTETALPGTDGDTEVDAEQDVTLVDLDEQAATLNQETLKAIATEPVRQIVFIDSAIAPGFQLETPVAPGTAIHFLPPGVDGIDHITSTLADHSDLTAIHLVSHGHQGQITLGTSELTSATLDGFRDSLASWASALAPDADILVYGCDVAQGIQGTDLLAGLAALTGADVAASDDSTGAAALGGDWVLEAATGPIETPALVAQYDGLLTPAVIAFNATGTDVGATGDNSHSAALATSDLDNDGDLDVVSVDRSGDVIIWQNDGTPFSGGTWTSHTIGSISGTNSVYTVTVGDLDSDGNQDFVIGTVHYEAYEIIAWQNDGTPFSGAWARNNIGSPGSKNVHTLELGDLDNDGDLDLLSGIQGGTYQIYVWENDGSPFAGLWSGNGVTYLGPTNTVYDATLGDLDNDGRLDIIAQGNHSAGVSVYQNDGTPFSGTWTGNNVGTVTSNVASIDVGDADIDGDLDIIYGRGNGDLILYENDGTPFSNLWTSNIIGTTVTAPQDLRFADLDNDGDIDVVGGAQLAESHQVIAWQNDRTPFTGTWAQVNIGTAAATVYSTTLGDLDNDGDIDVVSGSGLVAGNELIAWQNESTPPDTFGNANFVRGQLLSVPGGPPPFFHDVVLGDLDGDGDLDAYVTNTDSHMVWLGDGSGNFIDTGQSFGSGRSYGVKLADLDDDGDLDAFAANLGNNKVWTNDGSGNFTDSGQSLAGGHSRQVSLGDLDNDGDLDAFVVNLKAANQVLTNDGSGNFTDAGQYLGNATYSSRGVSLADIDNDGDLDAFVVTWNRTYGINEPNTTWINDGSGNFSAGQSFLVGQSNGVAVALGDVDNDGDLDAFVANKDFDRVWVNDGSGTLTDSGQTLGFPPGHQGFAGEDVRLGDLDNDGDLDAFVVNSGAGNYDKVWLNDGSGTFSDSGRQSFAFNAYNRGMDLGDLDHDGDLDAVVTNAHGGPVVWLNAPPRDYGDLPAPYDQTAYHDAFGPMLGTLRDSETAAQPNVTATGDDTSVSDDEDGVTFGAVQVGATGQEVQVRVSGGTAKLDAWIDFDRDGSFGGAGEQIFTSHSLGTGIHTLTFDVPSVAAGDAYARFRLSTAGGLGVGGQAFDGEVEDHVVTLSDPQIYDFSLGAYTAAEGDAPNTTNVVTVTRSGNTSGASSVDVVVAAGGTNPGTAGTDFTAETITVNFADGDTSAMVPVEFLGETTVELDETIALSLANPSGSGQIGATQSTAELTIDNDDSAVVSVIDATVMEGDAGTKTLSFAVSMDHEVDTNVTFDYTTQDDTATGGSDYVSVTTPATVTLAAGDTTGTIEITVNGDEVVELDEALDVLLDNLQAGGRDVTLTGTGIDGSGDWVQLGLDIDGEAAGDFFGGGVAMSADGRTVIIGATQNDGSTGDPNDDRGHARVFTWNGNAWVQKGDDIEGLAAGENMGIVAISDDGNTVGVSPHADAATLNDHIRIYRWDGSAWVQRGSSIANTDLSVNGNLTITLSANGDTFAYQDGGTFARSYEWDAGSNDWVQRGSDLPTGAPDISNDGNMLLVANTYQWHVPVFLAGRLDVYEWTGSDWAQRGSSLMGSATNTFVGLGAVLSGDGSTFATGRTEAGARQVGVYEWDGGSNDWIQKGPDIEIGVQSLSLSDDGNTLFVGSNHRIYAYRWNSGTSTWEQSGAEIVEDDGDNLGIYLDSSADGSTVIGGAYANDGDTGDPADNRGGAAVYRQSGTAKVTGTIENDDSATVSVSDPMVVEGDPGDANQLVFTLTLDKAVDTAVGAGYMTRDVTAEDENNDNDYTSKAGTVSFAGNVGETQEVRVDVTGDDTVELDETMELLLSSLTAGGRDVSFTGGGATLTGTGTIENDDSATVTIADASVIEGGDLVFGLTLDYAVDVDTTVTYSTADLSAIAGIDYTGASGATTVITAGSTSGTITVATTADTDLELDEDMLVTLDSLSAMGREASLSTAGTTTHGGLDAATGIILSDEKPTTAVTRDANGNLIVTDIEGANTHDTLSIYRSGGVFVIEDLDGHTVGTNVIGGRQISAARVEIDEASVTGGLTVDTLGDNDVINLGDLGTLNGPLTIMGGAGEDRIVQSGDVTLTGTGAADYTAEGIKLDMGSSLTTDSGAVTMTGTGGTGNLAGVSLKGAEILSTSGNVTLTGSGGTTGHYNRGVLLEFGSTVSTGGEVTLTGTGGSGGIHGTGVGIHNSTVESTGVGPVTITGSGGAGTLFSEGVSIHQGSVVDGGSGHVTVTGTGGSAGNMNRGINASNSDILSDGGNIEVLGQGGGAMMYGAGAQLTGVDLTTNDNGTVTLQGTGASGTLGNSGLVLAGASTVGTVDGDILVEGTANGTTLLNHGVQIAAGTQIGATGSGKVTVRGTGGPGTTNNVGVDLASGSGLSVNGGDLTIEGTARGGVTMNKGVSLANSALTSSGAGNIAVTGSGSAAATGALNMGIDANRGTINATGAGTIALLGTGGGGSSTNRGVKLAGATTVTTASGAIAVTGTGGGTGVGSAGISLETGSAVSAGTSGTVTLDGTGANGTLLNDGVLIGAASSVNTADGLLTIHGTGQGTASLNSGIKLIGGSINSTGGGAIVLNGTGSQTGTGVFNTGLNFSGGSVNTNTGNLTIEGHGGTGTTLNQGIRMVSTKLISIGGGQLSLSGDALNPGTTGVFNTGVYLLGVTLESSSSIGVTGTGGGGTALNHGIYMQNILPAGATVTTDGTPGGGATSKATDGNFF